MAYLVLCLALLVPLFFGLLLFLNLNVKFNTPFLKTYFVKVIEEKYPNYTVTISSVQVTSTPNLSQIRIVIESLNVVDMEQQSSLFIDKASIEFDLFDLITIGDRDYSIVLSELPIIVERSFKNDLEIKLGNFKLSNSEKHQKTFKNIKFLKINNPQLTILDNPSKVSLSPNVSSININFSGTETFIKLEALFPQVGLEEATIEFSAKYSKKLNSVEIDTHIKNLVPSKLYKVDDPRFVLFNKINIPIFGSLNFRLDKNRSVKDYFGTIFTHNVVLEKGALFNQKIKLKELSLDFVSSGDNSKVELKNIKIDSNFLVSSGRGELRFEGNYNFELFFSKFNLIDISGFTGELSATKASFEFGINLPEYKIVLKHAEMDAGETKLVAEGMVSLADKWAQEDYFKLDLLEVSYDYIQKIKLPKIKNFNSRILSLDNVNGLNLSLIFRINGSLEPEWEGSVSFEKALVSLSTLPEARFQLNGGVISFNERTLRINAKDIISSNKKFVNLALNDLKLTITNLQTTPNLNFVSNFNGDLSKVSTQTVNVISEKIGLEVNSNEILKKYSPLGFVNGRINGKLSSLDLMELTTTNIKVAIEFDDYALVVDPITKPFKISLIDIIVTEQETILKVNGSFNKRPLKAIFTKVFIKDVASVFKVDWKPNLIDLNGALGKEFRYSGSGNLMVQTEVTFPPNRSPIYRFKVDITDVALRIPVLGFTKAVNDPGIVEFGWSESQVVNFNFSSKGYELVGLIYLDLNQIIKKVKVHKVKLSDYFLGSASFVTGELENTVNIDGLMYDYEKSPKNTPLASRKNLKVIVNLSKLKLRRNLEINNFNGLFELNENLKGLGFGNLNNGPEVQIKLDFINDKKRYKVFSRNAGDVLLRSNIYSSGYGGELNFELYHQPGTDVAGSLHIRDMKVIGAPFLAKLISLSSIEGILGLLNSNGMVFNEIKAEYSLNKDFLHIENGIAINPSFGITLSGTREMNKKLINYRGLLSPAYSLNSIVKKIPLIGNLLGGNEGEGVFGINYFATGALRDPLITVNPLSIIAPGKFRELLN